MVDNAVERLILNFPIENKKHQDNFLRMRDSYTNPYELKRIESFEIFGLTKRIHETNLWKTGLRFGFANPPAWIRKDSFRAIVLRIHQDS